MLALAAMVVVIVAAGSGTRTAPPASSMDSSEYHCNQWLIAFDAFRRDDAMRGFDHAITLDPESLVGYIDGGFVLGKKGECKRASESIKKANVNKRMGIEVRIGMISFYGTEMVEDQEGGGGTGKIVRREILGGK